MDFCPRCGIRGTAGKLCTACGAAEQQLQRGKEIRMVRCTACGRARVRNRWVRGTTAASENAIRASMPKLKRIAVHDAGIPDGGPGLKREITIRATLDGEAYTLPARLITTLCPSCGKRHTQYFEGILQLRNPRPEIVEFIRGAIAEQSAKGVFLSREVLIRDGVDFHITSQRYLQALGNTLVKRFGGTLKVNASIFSRNRQTSRDLYRVNALYTAPDFAAGNVVDFGDGPVHITSTAGKVVGLNLRTGKRGPVQLRQQHRVLAAEKTRVVKVAPRVEVLDPETFQPVPVANAIVPKVAKGEKVRVVRADGRYYLT